jgi:cytochrome c oxidase subunit IV
MSAEGEGRALRRNIGIYIGVWCALMILLLLTAGSAYLRLGIWNVVVNMAIAALKTACVALVYMRLRRAVPLLRLVAALALLTLAVLFGLSHTDFMTRTTLAAPWQVPPR